MTDFIKENPKILDGIDTITFVPLTGRRLREREFNQSMVLAKILSREFGLPLREALVKTNSTKPQNELTRAERLINLKGVFKVKFGSRIKNSGMLLIDDVMTTGATLSECSKTLLDGGASKVNCLTLARGI